MEELIKMNETKKLELNQQEAQVLINLMDIAVRTRGLEAAQSALHLAGKIQSLFSLGKPDKPKNEKSDESK